MASSKLDDANIFVHTSLFSPFRFLDILFPFIIIKASINDELTLIIFFNRISLEFGVRRKNFSKFFFGYFLLAVKLTIFWMSNPFHFTSPFHFLLLQKNRL